MYPRQIETLLIRLTTTSHRYVSRKGFKGNEDYQINPDGKEAAKLIKELLAERQRLVSGQMDALQFSRALQGEVSFLRVAFEEALDTIDAADSYIEASDQELAAQGITRQEALKKYRHRLSFAASPFMQALRQTLKDKRFDRPG